MKLELRREQIPAGRSAYDLWSRELEAPDRQDNEDVVFLQPALIRLIVSERFPDLDRARRFLAEEVRRGALLMDAWEFEELVGRIGPDPDGYGQDDGKGYGQDDGKDYGRDDGKDGGKGGRSGLEEADRPAAAPEGGIQQVYWEDADTGRIEDEYRDLFEIITRGRPIAAPRSRPRLAVPELVDGPPIPEGTPIVAVIDDGIGFLNTRFAVKPGGGGGYRTRFHAVWLQAFRTITIPPFGSFYVQAGQALYRAEIDALLAKGDLLDEGATYREIDRGLLEPGAHRSLEQGFSHGTHVFDIAAGADPEAGDPVSDWPLIGVQLPPEAVDNTAGTQLEPCIIQGVRWILHEAERINNHSPVVINISFATFAGPKDGTKAIEALIAEALADWQARTGRCAWVVYSFGNDYRSNQIARFALEGEDWQSVEWRVQADNFAASFVEIRPDDPADLLRMGVRVTPPGESAPLTLGPIPASTAILLIDGSGSIVAVFFHIGAHSTAPGVTTPACYVFAMAPTAEQPFRPRAPFGPWEIGLQSIDGGCFAARIEVQRGDTPHGYRLNGRQSYLDHHDAYDWDAEELSFTLPGPEGPITRAGTHSSFVTAPSFSILSVGAATADLYAPTPDHRPSRYSAAGADWLFAQPVLAAFGDMGAGLAGIVASGTHSGSGRTSNGTSASAAQAARTLATEIAASGCTPAQDQAEFDARITQLVSLYGSSAAGGDADRLGAGVLTKVDGGRARG